MLKVTVKNNVVFPEIKLSEHLEEIADKIIIDDIVRGIHSHRSIDGGQFPPNSPETRKRKGHGDQLRETGTLLGSFFSKAISKNKVVVSIKGDRKEIGGYLQDGIKTKSGIKQYIFFGISKDAFEGAIKYMKNVIEEMTSGKSAKR